MEEQYMDRGNMGQRDRSAQKRRTRRAILAAAAALMQQNEAPTADRVAEVAEVSRRTVYLYFPSQEQLLTEAALEGVRTEIEQALELASTDDIWSRLDVLVDATLQACLKREVQLRTMIRLSVERRLAEAQGGPSQQAPLRGGRRVEWIETALAPIREQLGEVRFERLVSALTVCVGIDALLVLRDIRGLDVPEILQVSRWTAHALLRASLEERA
jgi:AcrR family transcriptional regulator